MVFDLSNCTLNFQFDFRRMCRAPKKRYRRKLWRNPQFFELTFVSRCFPHWFRYTLIFAEERIKFKSHYPKVLVPGYFKTMSWFFGNSLRDTWYTKNKLSEPAKFRNNVFTCRSILKFYHNSQILKSFVHWLHRLSLDLDTEFVSLASHIGVSAHASCVHVHSWKCCVSQFAP